MNTNEFYYDLPEALIAQYPLANRSDSKLLVYARDTKTLVDESFSSICDYLQAGDLLVLNNTKVMRARLYGRKSSGGKIECLIERISGPTHCLCHIKASKSPKTGSAIILEGDYQLKVLGRVGELFECQLQGGANFDRVLDEVGHIPLPPYINRQDEATDFSRYQTVYAEHDGSVAAPTAGLHFDEALLDKIKRKGVDIDYVTLHVGAGTFQPVRVRDIKTHKMHSESFDVSKALCRKIVQTKQRGQRVIAVGTTVVRSLESSASQGDLQAHCGETDIFIFPGYEFKVCDGVLTNFHLPESTLLMLVAAFIGHQEVMTLYQYAMDEQYRFFSYGDACLLI